jgi:uncharacterized RDD family membrane protein YckC
MTLTCIHCGKTLDFSGPAPSFCAYCGKAFAAERDPIHDAQTVLGGDVPPGAGPRQPADTLGNMPERFAGYTLKRLLGRGGMGAVYEAEDVANGQRVALKLVTAEGAGADALARFRQEGRLAAAIAHPRCVFIRAADEEAGRPFIVMELMPGSTLQDLVREQGPLPVGHALARILDVIEGLQEAHRLGLIHRDVKPSNCFVDDDGRVKVGDFGLSKSLLVDLDLTRTGVFLGTPLYASPEQIRGDPIDARTDVYSTAATLYFLLTGRAPFESGDPAATLARIVTDSPPALRTVRSDIPPELDRVILKGLERDRERRWRDLGSFANALEPYLPGRLTAAGLGLRVGAYVLDVHVSKLVILTVLNMWVVVSTRGRITPRFDSLLVSAVLDAGIVLVFFALMEGVWGASPGKRIMGLRVSADEAWRPQLQAVAIRTLVFYALGALPWEAAVLAGGLWRMPVWFTWVTLPLRIAGLAVLAASMRRTNGFRGLHELASGTRVVRARRTRWRRAPRRTSVEPATEQPSFQRSGLPSRVGPYPIQGALRWSDTDRVLAGRDPILGRAVWIHWTECSRAPNAARRDLDRPARLRWLAGGNLDGLAWDAYLAPSGQALTDAVADRRLAWTEVQPLLEQLADELVDATADGTLPPRLGLGQVWLGGGSRPVLDDVLESGEVVPALEPDRDFALALLADAAVLALEGRKQMVRSRACPVRAAVPVPARRVLDRLTGVAQPFTDVAEARAAVRQLADSPAELGVITRLGRIFSYFFHLVLGIPLAYLIVVLANLRRVLLVQGPIASSGGESFATIMNVSLLPILGVLAVIGPAAAWLLRGGFADQYPGVAVVREDGLKPSRAHCAWRELIMWLPTLLFLLAAHWNDVRPSPVAFAVSLCLGLGAVVAAVADAAHDFFVPGRMLHDRLAKTCAVPK